MRARKEKKYTDVIKFIRSIYKTKKFIPLHEPRFIGNEKKYLNECINSTYVSSVGKFVDSFEKKLQITLELNMQLLLPMVLLLSTFL